MPLGPESLSFIGSGMAAGVAVAAAALVVAGRRATLAMGTQRPLARSADREDRTGTPNEDLGGEAAAAEAGEVDGGAAEAEPTIIEYPSKLQVSLSTKHFEVTPAIRDHVDEKIKKVLERFGPYILTLDTHLDVLRNPKGKDEKHTAELVAAVRPGYSSKTVRVCVKETSDDMYLAINQVTQQLERKVRQLKEKGQKKRDETGGTD
jgi:ribosomal subunit interface protein